MIKKVFWICALVLIFPATLSAAQQTENLVPGLGRMVAAFSIVLILIFVSVRLFKRLALRGSGVGKGYIKVIDSFPLHQRARLNVIEVAGRVFLISVTDHDVSMIAEYDPMEFADREGDGGRRNFIGYLQMFRRRQGSDEEVSAM